MPTDELSPQPKVPTNPEQPINDNVFMPVVLERPDSLEAKRAQMIAGLAEQITPPPGLVAGATRIDHVRLPDGNVEFVIADPDNMPLAMIPWENIERRATQEKTLPVLWLGENLTKILPENLPSGTFRPHLPVRPTETESPLGIGFFEQLNTDEEIQDIINPVSRVSQPAKLEKVRVRASQIANDLRLKAEQQFTTGESVQTNDGAVTLTQVFSPPIMKINVDPIRIKINDLPYGDIEQTNNALNLAVRLTVLAESFDVLYVSVANSSLWEQITGKIDPMKALQAAISQSPVRSRLLALADIIILGTGGWALQRLYQLDLPAADPLTVSLGVKEFHTGRLPVALDARSLTESLKAVKSGRGGVRNMLTAARDDLNAIKKADKYMQHLIEAWEKSERN